MYHKSNSGNQILQNKHIKPNAHTHIFDNSLNFEICSVYKI